jgi:hypothetical protein
MRPMPTPHPPSIPDTADTGEFPVVLTKKEKRTIKRALVALASLLTALTGGGAWSHFSGREHATRAVNERVAVTEYEIEQLKVEVGALKLQQASDTQQILDAIERKR